MALVLLTQDIAAMCMVCSYKGNLLVDVFIQASTQNELFVWNVRLDAPSALPGSVKT